MKTEIIKLDNFGRGITYIDGVITFVDEALPGEIVKIRITKRTRKYFLAEVIDYYRLSDDRIEVECEYNDVCGGCNLAHMSVAAELNFKCNKVKEILKKFGNIRENIVEEIVGDQVFYYRNKVTLHGDGKNLGFYSKGTKKVIRVEKCLLAPAIVNEIIVLLQEQAIVDKINEAVIRVSNDNSEVMVSLKGDINNYEMLKNKVDVLEVNGEILLGEDHIISTIGEKKYCVSSESFFQINETLTEKLYNEVMEVTKNNKPKRVLDLYCGTGTIGLYIASLVEKVVGVDSSASGIKDARDNAKLNNNDNCSFICDKVENVIDSFGDFDMVIVDPPRAGLDSKTIEYIKKIKAKDLMYISCDPVTLGRDLKELQSDYEVIKVKPYNMFPRSYHVETCVLLSKLKSTPHIEVEINLDELELTKAESKATYAEIKQYVLENTGLKVSQLYIAQVKRKHGLIERVNYNLGDGKVRVPQVTPEKEQAIEDALRHFQMI